MRGGGDVDPDECQPWGSGGSVPWKGWEAGLGEGGGRHASRPLSAGDSSCPLHPRSFLPLLPEPSSWPALVWSEQLPLLGGACCVSHHPKAGKVPRRDPPSAYSIPTSSSFLPGGLAEPQAFRAKDKTMSAPRPTSSRRVGLLPPAVPLGGGDSPGSRHSGGWPQASAGFGLLCGIKHF